MKSSSCRAIGPSTARRLIWEMAAAVRWFVSPRLAESISPENRSDEYQHSQDFQSSQQHSNGEQPFGGIR
ncbi:hypothetical protein D3C86_1367260 [compost metagenome]